jgi:hypothetical protein
MVEFMKANLDEHLGKPERRSEERLPKLPPDQILR